VTCVCQTACLIVTECGRIWLHHSEKHSVQLSFAVNNKPTCHVVRLLNTQNRCSYVTANEVQIMECTSQYAYVFLRRLDGVTCFESQTCELMDKFNGRKMYIHTHTHTHTHTHIYIYIYIYIYIGQCVVVETSSYEIHCQC